MLKKNTPIKFSKPVSTMRTVFEAVDRGISNRQIIIDETKLQPGQVRSALFNLVYIGAVIAVRDAQGVSMYGVPGRVGGVAPCLKGVRSIFDVSLRN